MEQNDSLIDAMEGLLEAVTGKADVNLNKEVEDNPDFSNYSKKKITVETGGHIPLEKDKSINDYCVHPSKINVLIDLF